MAKVPQFAPDAAIGSRRLYQFMTNVDLVGKLSDRLGTSTENLAGFLHAADLGGATQADVISALERLNVNLAAATKSSPGTGSSQTAAALDAGFDAAITGTGRAAKALDRIGLSPLELVEMDNVEAVKLIADALVIVPNETLRAAFASQIFGPAGVALLNTLQGGSSGITQLHNEAVRLGLTFSRSEAAMVEAANDAWNRAVKVLAGIGNQWAIQFSPLIALGSNKLRELALSGWTATQTISILWAMLVELTAFLADWVQLTGKGLIYLMFVGASEYVWLMNRAGACRNGLDRILRSLCPAIGPRFCLAASTSVPSAVAGYALKVRCSRSLGRPLTAGDGVRQFFKEIRDRARHEAVVATRFRNPSATIGPLETATTQAEPTGIRSVAEPPDDVTTGVRRLSTPLLRIFDPADISDDHSIEVLGRNKRSRVHRQRNRRRKRRAQRG